MAEPDAIPVSASVASTGLGIRYIGNWAYAYSGAVDCDNNATTLLLFTSGSGLIAAEFYTPRMDTDNNVEIDFFWQITFNGVAVYRCQNPSSFQVPQRGEVRLMIPPFTVVEMIAKNIYNTTTHPMGGIMTGRVYGAE